MPVSNGRRKPSADGIGCVRLAGPFDAFGQIGGPVPAGDGTVSRDSAGKATAGCNGGVGAVGHGPRRQNRGWSWSRSRGSTTGIRLCCRCRRDNVSRPRIRIRLSSRIGDGYAGWRCSGIVTRGASCDDKCNQRGATSRSKHLVVCLGFIRACPARHRRPSRRCPSLPYAPGMAASVRLARNAAAVAIHGAKPKTHH